MICFRPVLIIYASSGDAGHGNHVLKVVETVVKTRCCGGEGGVINVVKSRP